MIKKIKIIDVRLGMYIHEICGEWMHHPFWKKSFKLEKQNELDQLLSCGLKEVWIDTCKGLDAKVFIEKDQKISDINADIKTSILTKNDLKATSFQDELVCAKRIQLKSKKIVITMFNDVRMGNSVDAQKAVVLVDEVNQSLERNPGALLNLIGLKKASEYTYMHSVAVCVC